MTACVGSGSPVEMKRWRKVSISPRRATRRIPAARNLSARVITIRLSSGDFNPSTKSGRVQNPSVRGDKEEVNTDFFRQSQRCFRFQDKKSSRENIGETGIFCDYCHTHISAGRITAPRIENMMIALT